MVQQQVQSKLILSRLQVIWEKLWNLEQSMEVKETRLLAITKLQDFGAKINS